MLMREIEASDQGKEELEKVFEGVDKTWGRPWPRPWRRPWPTLWPTLWPTGGQIKKKNAEHCRKSLNTTDKLNLGQTYHY